MSTEATAELVPRECRRLKAGRWIYKVRHETRADAVATLSPRDGMSAYVCPDCSFWHVGRRP